jgi:hypothetical protein
VIISQYGQREEEDGPEGNPPIEVEAATRSTGGQLDHR